MTMVLTNRASDYDGSPLGDNDIFTATGPIVVTFSKPKGESYTEVFSRSDTADFVSTAVFMYSGRYLIHLVSGDEFYFKVYGVVSSDAIDISYVST